MPPLRWLIAGILPLRPEFDANRIHVKFVVDIGTGIGFSTSTPVFPFWYHSTNNLYWFIPYRHYVIFITDKGENVKMSLSTPWRVDLWFHILDLSTSAGKWSTSRCSCFTPRKECMIPTQKEVGWAPQPVWTFLKRQKLLAPWDLNPGLSIA